MRESINDPLVDGALERDHEVGKVAHRLPAPFDEFRLVAAGRRVITPDMRGFGASGRPEAVEAYRLRELVGGDSLWWLDRRDGVYIRQVPDLHSERIRYAKESGAKVMEVFAADRRPLGPAGV